MNFVAIDFETANEYRGSACALGLVEMEDGCIKASRYWLIRPREMRFEPINVWIHGIRPEDVEHEPEFDEIWKQVYPLLAGKFVLAHNSGFDMSVLRYALTDYRIEFPTLDYSCTRIISKAVWPGLMGYGLDIVADHLGIDFEHHQAEQDAWACAAIAQAACEQCEASSIADLSSRLGIRNGKISPERWAGVRSNRVPKASTQASRGPTSSGISSPDNCQPAHPFFRKNVVFTGTLKSMPRREAMQRVIDLGGTCSDGSVLNSTSFLVVGELDIRRLVHGDKSNKIIKAERLISEGHELEIMTEDDFLRLVR